MILIQEVNQEPMEFSILEEGTQKNLYISGIFMQTETKNRNGRVYPKSMMEKKISEFTEFQIKTSKAMGELTHPATPEINLDRVSHLITHLAFEGNNIMGKAKVLNTPCGNTLKGLIEGGVKLGVSSRGVGSVINEKKCQMVQDDFKLITVDAVADPSAHDAWVSGLMEQKEWIWENGIWKESTLTQAKKEMDMLYTEARAIELFSQFLKTL